MAASSAASAASDEETPGFYLREPLDSVKFTYAGTPSSHHGIVYSGAPCHNMS